MTLPGTKSQGEGGPWSQRRGAGAGGADRGGDLHDVDALRVVLEAVVDLRAGAGPEDQHPAHLRLLAGGGVDQHLRQAGVVALEGDDALVSQKDPAGVGVGVGGGWGGGRGAGEGGTVGEGVGGSGRVQKGAGGRARERRGGGESPPVPFQQISQRGTYPVSSSEEISFFFCVRAISKEVTKALKPSIQKAKKTPCMHTYTTYTYSYGHTVHSWGYGVPTAICAFLVRARMKGELITGVATSTRRLRVP